MPISFKEINRIGEVIQILLKYGFEDLVENTHLKRLIPRREKAERLENDRSIPQFTVWERIRMVMEELGPTFIKLAQSLSNRPDLLKQPLIAEFEKLQSDVAPIHFDMIKSCIESELGKTLNQLFADFDAQPLGSASIGQVHRARLHSGDEVVIKVQRPGSSEKVHTDLNLIKEFVKYTENYFKKRGIFNPREIVEAFEESIKRELDYTSEALNLKRFRKIYQNEVGFYIPKTYREYSTEKILCIEFIQGCKITDTRQLQEWGLNPHKIVEKGINIYLKQMFELGYFHADPHPGNILIRPNGTLVLIDFGMVGKLMKHQRFAFAGIFIGLANQDAKAMALNLRRLSLDNEIDNAQAFENDLYELIENFLIYGEDDSGMPEFVAQLQKIIYNYRLQIPGNIFLILRALAILEGIGKTLHPQFATLDFIRPYGLKLLAEQFSFKNQRSEVGHSLSQLVSLLYIFPIELKMILRKIREGQLNTYVKVQGAEEWLYKVESITNRLILTFLIAALLIASAVGSSGTQTISWISIMEFILALILGICLIFYTFFYSQKRKKRKS